LSLTACGPSADEMNKRVIKGCGAGVEHILNQHIQGDYSFVSLAKATVDRAGSVATVNFDANVLYREFSEEEQSYKCVFHETKNLMSYRAEIDYVEAEGEKYGRVNDKLTNLSVSEFSTFNEAVRLATH
ncbi:MAG: hypothetical protein ACPG05_04540, partial [Bdellovibrionales bacterium]